MTPLNRAPVAWGDLQRRTRSRDPVTAEEEKEMTETFDQSRRRKKVTTNRTDSKIRNQPELAVRNSHCETLRHPTPETRKTSKETSMENTKSNHLPLNANNVYTKNPVDITHQDASSSSCYGYPSD